MEQLGLVESTGIRCVDSGSDGNMDTKCAAVMEYWEIRPTGVRNSIHHQLSHNLHVLVHVIRQKELAHPARHNLSSGFNSWSFTPHATLSLAHYHENT